MAQLHRHVINLMCLVSGNYANKNCGGNCVQVMTDFLPSEAELTFNKVNQIALTTSNKKITQSHTKPPCHSHAVSNAGAPPNSGNVA